MTTNPREFALGAEMRVRILTAGDETGGRFDLAEVVQSAGASTPLHVHTRYEERIYVLDGSLTLWAGDEEHTLKAGGFHAIPLHVPHAIEAGPEGRRALVFSSPAGFAELVARAGTPAEVATAAAELDIERLAVVSAELGDVMLGPPGTIPADFTARSDEARR
jgi:quercetin dioxygenase-like cupin family protein